MVGDDHQLAGPVVAVHGPGGVGEDEGPHAQALEHPHGDGELLKVVALVVVEAAGHAHHPLPCHGAEDQLARVGGHGGHQKIGDVAVIHNNGILDGIGKGAQGRAQDNGDLRRLGHDAAQIGAGDFIIALIHGGAPFVFFYCTTVLRKKTEIILYFPTAR